jgi:hypothetical protein
MPILPTIRTARLHQVTAGSLVSVAAPNGAVFFGLRVVVGSGQHGDPAEPAFVRLSARDDGTIAADFIPTYNPGGWLVNGNSVVVSHSDKWCIQAKPTDWDARPSLRTFGANESGLLLNKGEEFGLVATDPGHAGLGYLRLGDWVLQQPNTEHYIATKNWTLLLPGIDGKYTYALFG